MLDMRLVVVELIDTLSSVGVKYSLSYLDCWWMSKISIVLFRFLLTGKIHQSYFQEETHLDWPFRHWLRSGAFRISLVGGLLLLPSYVKPLCGGACLHTRSEASLKWGPSCILRPLFSTESRIRNPPKKAVPGGANRLMALLADVSNRLCIGRGTPQKQNLPVSPWKSARTIDF